MPRRLGQHFLRNTSALQLIATTLHPAANEVLIEIGPGHGELTRVLRSANAQVKIVAREKDTVLAKRLEKDFEDDGGIKILEGDVLASLPVLTLKPEFRDRNYKIVGNIPYYITGHLFRIVGELENKPTRCVFTVQKEVALRVCAMPPHMNRLAASIQSWADVKIIKTLDQNDFSPPPKVVSAIVLLELKPTVIKNVIYDAAIHALFAQPRKTIINNLLASTKQDRKVLLTRLSALGIAGNDRPQVLSVDRISSIAKIFFSNHRPEA